MLDLDGHLAGDGVEQLAELAGHVVGDLLRALDEVEMATAGIGDGGQERLVEVGPDAEGARADARGAQVGRKGGQRRRIGDAVVGQAIGQEQAAVDAIRAEVGLDAIGPGGPAAMQVGGAAGVHVLEPQQRLRLIGRAGEAGGDHGLNPIVVGDDGKPILGRQAGERALDGVLGERQLRPGHGAGPIEDESDVDRGALRRLAGSLLGRGRPEQDVARGARAGADELAVGAGGERGHVAPPSGGQAGAGIGSGRQRLGGALLGVREADALEADGVAGDGDACLRHARSVEVACDSSLSRSSRVRTLATPHATRHRGRLPRLGGYAVRIGPGRRPSHAAVSRYITTDITAERIE